MRTLAAVAVLMMIFSGGIAGANNFCSQTHELDAKAKLINQSPFNEFLVPSKNGFSGFSLVGEVFRAREFSTWEEVQSFYNSLPRHDRMVLSSRISASKISLPDYVARLLRVAQAAGGELSYGIKDLTSLKHKILDRIQSYQKNGYEFTLADLSDISRGRISLPFSSPLLSLTTAGEWAKALSIRESSIVGIDIKNGPESTRMNNYYTAVHLTIRGAGGQNFELQIMSKAMAVWHGWDHENVYKSKAAQNGQNNFKLYSIDWGRIIHRLANTASIEDRRERLQALATNYGIMPSSSNNQRSLVTSLDQAIKKELRLKSDEGFSSAELSQLADALWNP